MSLRTDPRTDIEERASAILESFGIRRWPVDVASVAKLKRIRLRYEPLDEELSGMCFLRGEEPVICVNAWHSNNRQRFTIAHEIGHIELHMDQLKRGALVDKSITILRRDTKATSGLYLKEIEANSFAAALLMPRSFIDLYTKEQGLGDGILKNEEAIEDMAKEFEVSTMAMAIRIGNIWN